jgi:hypothetical protein
MIWEDRGLDAHKKVNGRKDNFSLTVVEGFGLPKYMLQTYMTVQLR